MREHIFLMLEITTNVKYCCISFNIIPLFSYAGSRKEMPITTKKLLIEEG